MVLGQSGPNCSDRCPYKKGTQSGRRRGRDRSDAATRPGAQGPLATGRDEAGPSPRACGSSEALLTPRPRTTASRTGREKLLFAATQPWSLLQQPRDTDPPSEPTHVTFPADRWAGEKGVAGWGSHPASCFPRPGQGVLLAYGPGHSHREKKASKARSLGGPSSSQASPIHSHPLCCLLQGASLASDVLQRRQSLGLSSETRFLPTKPQGRVAREVLARGQPRAVCEDQGTMSESQLCEAAGVTPMFLLSVWPRCHAGDRKPEGGGPGPAGQRAAARVRALPGAALPDRPLAAKGGLRPAGPDGTLGPPQDASSSLSSWHRSVYVTQSLSAEPRGQNFCA